MASETEKNEAETETPQHTPASTPESSPIAEPHKDASDDVNNVKEKLEELTIEPATVEARAVDPTPAAVVTNDSDSAKEEKPLPNPWTDLTSLDIKQPTTASYIAFSQHLEAYVLRPHVETFKEGVIWSSKIELLNLDEAAMRAHINKLGPEYSIIDAVSDLLPEQLILVQGQTKSRNGRLVSVQHSAPADMVTTMGTFKVKSVIFIIVTSSGDRDAPAGTKTEVKALDVKPLAHPFTSPQTFQPQPNWDRNDLEEHFTTITSKKEYGPNPPSLEELRVRDYAVGNTGPLMLNSDFSPFRDKKPFGGQYVNPKASANTSTASQPTSSTYQNVFRITNPPDRRPFRPGPFSGSRLVVPTGQGLFGGVSSAPSSSSLFGKPAASSPTGIFGAAPPISISPFATTPKDPGTGLFDRTSMSEPSTGSWTFRKPPPTQSSLFNTPKEPASGQPATTPSSTSLFDNFTNPKPATGGIIGQRAPSSKPDVWRRECKRCSTYVSFDSLDEPDLILCKKCMEKQEKTCWLCDKNDQQDDANPEVANPTVSALEEKKDEVLPSTPSVPAPAVNSAIPYPPNTTKEPKAPSTGISELDLQSCENVFLSTSTRQFFVDGKGAAWRQLGPELPAASSSTPNPYMFGQPKQKDVKKEGEPCKHKTVVGIFCQGCRKATKSLFEGFGSGK